MSTQVDIFDSPKFKQLDNFATGFGFWAAGDAPGTRLWWPSAEHYFQAGKFSDPDLRAQVRLAGEPGQAKALGRRLGPIREDWDAARRGRIHRAMLEKLWAHKSAREVLLHIPEGVRIVNGNRVDPYFGIGPDGLGQNVIGLVLEELRQHFSTFPHRRTVMVKVAGVGEPFEPNDVNADLTGAAPAALGGLAAQVLGVPVSAVEDVALLTEGGFDRARAEGFAGIAELESFLNQHHTDCVLEVSLQDSAVVTLWDGYDDRYLCRTDVRHLCPTAQTLRERMEALMPLLSHAAFRGRVTFTVDGDEDVRELDESSFPSVLAAAAQGADVVVAGNCEIPAEPQAALRSPPSLVDLGSPQVRCGDHTPLDAQECADRIAGIIWGAALGDAVGLATEFMNKETAAEKYPGPDGLSPLRRVDDRHRSRWPVGDWTDDTDQLVLLLDALVSGGGVLDARCFAASLKRWKEQGFPELGDKSGLGIGQTVHSVMEHPAFDVAPEVASQAVWKQSGCTIAANGAIMRCAVSGVPYFWDSEAVRHNALAGAAVTHADPRCAASCMVVASIVARVLMGVDLSNAKTRSEEVALACCTAVEHLDGGDSDELWRATDVLADGLEGLELGRGGIGYTYKTLGAACWAFVHAKDFTQAIQAISMEAGDADSNAAVAGALLGARFGYSKLPRTWLDELPKPQVEWLIGKVASLLRLLGLEGSSSG